MTATIRPGHMATDMAALAGVLGIDQHHWHTGFVRFVLYEGAQLGERPTMHLGALRLPEPCIASDVLEVFQSDSARSVFGNRNECLTDSEVS